MSLNFNDLFQLKVIFKSWSSHEGRGILDQKLSNFLGSSTDPFQTLIALSCHKDKPKAHGYIKDMVSGFLQWLKSKTNYAELQQQYLNKDMILNAFQLYVTTLAVNGEVLCKICDIFMFKSETEYLLPSVKNLLHQQQNYVIASLLIAKLKAYDKFEVRDIMIRLLLADRIQALEAFVQDDNLMQVHLVSLLDSWLPLSENEIQEECKGSCHDIDAIKPAEKLWEKLVHKTVKKLVARLAKKFEFEKSHEICPNLFKEKTTDTLRYNNKEYCHNSIDEGTYLDNVEEFVLKGKDPGFPQFALFVLENLSASSFNVMRNLNNNDLAKFALKWEVPLATVEKTLPEIAKLVSSETVNMDSALEDNYLTEFYFQLPQDLCIVFIDAVEKYKDSCQTLLAAEAVGIDCEWPSTKVETSLSPVVSLLQLATKNSAYLFDINFLKKHLQECDWKTGVGALFDNDNVIKLGYGLREDLEHLSSTVKDLSQISLRNSIDLKTVIERIEDLHPQLLRDFDITTSEYDKITGGLSGVVQHLLGKALDKSPQRSNWNLRPLRETQLRYAALDAHVLIPVYQIILARMSESEMKDIQSIEFYASGKLTDAEAKSQEVAAKEKREGKAKMTEEKKSGFKGLQLSGPTRQPVIAAGPPPEFSDDSDDSFGGSFYSDEEDGTLAPVRLVSQTDPVLENLAHMPLLQAELATPYTEPVTGHVETLATSVASQNSSCPLPRGRGRGRGRQKYFPNTAGDDITKVGKIASENRQLVNLSDHNIHVGRIAIEEDDAPIEMGIGRPLFGRGCGRTKRLTKD